MSANVATSEILSSLAETGFRTLAFSRARVSAELVLRYTRKRVEEGGLVQPNRIESYRAGYTPKERREIERSLFKASYSDFPQPMRWSLEWMSVPLMP